MSFENSLSKLAAAFIFKCIRIREENAERDLETEDHP